MNLTQLKKIIKEETRKALKEQSNPELDKAVDRFVKGLASKYGYQSSDAVMAVFEAMKRLGLLDTTVNYKSPGGVQEAGGLMGTLGGTHPMQDPEMRQKVVEPTLGPNYDAFIMFKSPQYKQMKDKYPDSVTKDWEQLYRSSNYQGYASVSPDGKVIKAAILDGGGIVGAFYIKK